MIPAVLLLWSLAPHDEKLSASRIEAGSDGVRWIVDLSTEGLHKVLPFPVEPLDLEDDDLAAASKVLGDYVLRNLRVEVGGARLEGRLGPPEAVREVHLASGRPYIAHVRFAIRFDAPRTPERLRLAATFFSEITDDHQAVLRVRWGAKSRLWKFRGPFELELRKADIDPSVSDTLRVFTLWGMEHIFIGYDHIAFLLALLLGATKLGGMVRIVTSFTVAHSLTLALSAADVVRVRSSVTEAMIAASIVYVAVENLFAREPKHRWILTFGFGLVHGLGFSNVLREKLDGLDGILLPVVSFNLGVELGQLAILLVLFPVLGLLRKGADEAASARRRLRLARFGSVPLLLLGLGWLLDRVFQLGWMP
jgi:hydrogenase/urease accessory protein HupE